MLQINDLIIHFFPCKSRLFVSKIYLLSKSSLLLAICFLTSTLHLQSDVKTLHKYLSCSTCSRFCSFGTMFNFFCFFNTFITFSFWYWSSSNPYFRHDIWSDIRCWRPASVFAITPLSSANLTSLISLPPTLIWNFWSICHFSKTVSNETIHVLTFFRHGVFKWDNFTYDNETFVYAWVLFIFSSFIIHVALLLFVLENSFMIYIARSYIYLP